MTVGIKQVHLYEASKYEKMTMILFQNAERKKLFDRFYPYAVLFFSRLYLY